MRKNKRIVTIGFIIVIAVLSVIVFWQKHQSLQNKLSGNVYQVEAINHTSHIVTAYYVFKGNGQVYGSFSKKDALTANTNSKYFKQQVAAENKLIDTSYHVTNNHQFEVVYRNKQMDTVIRYINIKADKNNNLYGNVYVTSTDKANRKLSDKVNRQAAKSAIKVKLLLVK